MSLKHPAEEVSTLDAATLHKLMAYADGELEGAALSEIEALMKANPEALRVVEELNVLSDCVRIVAEARPIAVPDGIADAVIARIHEAVPKTAPQSGQARVIALASRRRRTYGLVAGLVAAAAAVVLVARLTNEEAPSARLPTPPPSLVAPLVAPLVPAQTSPSALALAPAPAEAPSSVSVIVVPSEGETASSIVIWLGEESPSGGPVK